MSLASRVAKPWLYGLAMDWSKFWEPAHVLELKCRKKNTAHTLEGSLRGQSTSRSATSGAAWEKPGNLRDRPADKISACSDQGSEDQEDLSAGSSGLLCASGCGLFL